MNTVPTPIVAVDEHAVAAAIGMSVHWVRKDRSTKRLLPFVKLGTSVRYDLQRCHAAFAAMECGGPGAQLGATRP